jgi:hypothetical protein
LPETGDGSVAEKTRNARAGCIYRSFNTRSQICDSCNNTDLVVIPGGMTSQLQALDVVVNKPFKDHLKHLYSEWLLAGDYILTPTGKIQKPSVSLLCQWIKISWQRICPEVVVKGFKKCCVSKAMVGREDEEEAENVVSESDEVGSSNSESGEVGSSNSESGEVGNDNSGGDEVGNCEDSETNW